MTMAFAIHQSQVFDAIISLVAIKMMDMFTSKKLPTQSLLHNPTMFQVTRTINRDPSVTGSIGDSLRRRIAGFRAKAPSRLAACWHMKGDATDTADDVTIFEIVWMFAPNGQSCKFQSRQAVLSQASARAIFRSRSLVLGNIK